MSKLILPITAPVQYEVQLPGSKSIALRQLLISALAKSESTLNGLPACDDVDAMVDGLERLGTRLDGSVDQGLRVTPNFNRDDDLTIYARQSGVTLRLMLAVAALRTGKTHYFGTTSLAQRPNGALLDALAKLGCEIDSIDGKLPITITGPAVRSNTSLDATVSSQFLSALLISAPVLANGLSVQLTDTVASASYAAGTVGEMAKRGVDVEYCESSNVYTISPQQYLGGCVSIEGDASAATYHMALAVLHGGTVHINNVGTQTWQGDYEFTTVCEKLGATVERTRSTTTVTGPEKLRALPSIDMTSMPDAAPTLMAICPFLPEPTTITGLGTLRHKECDRITCPATELNRAAIRAEEGPAYLKIWPGVAKPTVFQTYDDHRMAMAFTVLATKAQGCRINDPLCVNKTYTNFWYDLGRAYPY